jgi:replication factor C large subunit
MLWCQKHRPKNLEEVVGNAEVLEEVRVWANDWNRDVKGKPLLLHGPPGIGKSALVYALANSMDWDVVEMNASNLRNEENVKRVAGAAASSASLLGGKKLIIIDEVDSLQAGDRGGGKAIFDAINESAQPIILIANDVWSQNLGSIRSASKPLEMKRINSRTIASILAKIANKENIDVSKEVVERIAKENNGDLRSAINDLQALGEGRGKIEEKDFEIQNYRDREKSVFESLRTIFKSNTYDEASRALWGLDVDRGMLIRWIEENIPIEYEKREDICNAFDILSRADVFEGRIHKRQYWGFLRYINILITAGIALSKKEPYRKFVKYEFPKIIKKLGASRGERAKRRAVGLRISKKCHVSSKDAVEIYLPLIKLVCSETDNIPKVKDYFGFDEEELAFILEISEKKVEKVLNGPKKKREMG